MRTLQFEAKMFFQQRLIYILIPLSLFYLVMGLQYGVIALPLTYVSQFLIFGFLVIGYWTGIREQNKGSNGVLNALPSSHKHWVSELVSPMSYALLLIGLLLLVYTGIALKEQASISWIMNGIRFMLLYFLLPSLICLMIGLVLAQIIHSKIAYVVILVIGFLVGPIGSEVYHTFMGFLFAEGGPAADVFYLIGSRVINFFRLTQYSTRDLPNQLYGYVAESVLFYRSLCFFFAMIGVYFLLPMTKTLYPKSKHRLKMMSGISIALAILFGVLMQQQVFVYRQGSTDEFGEENFDSLWVQQNPVVEIADRDPDIIISAIEGELDLRKSLHFTGKISFANPNRTDHFALKLYRGFLVKELEIADAESSWKQEGDWIYVTMENPDTAGVIEIEYTGFSSPYFFAGEQAVFLPGYFAFLPQMSSQPVFGVSENKDIHLNAFVTTDTTFDLKVQSNAKIASNLMDSGGRWKGQLENEGPVFIGGHLEETAWNGIPLYIAGLREEKREVEYLTKLFEMTERIRTDLGREAVKPLERIFFVPYNNSVMGNSHGIQQGSTLYVHSIMQRVEPTLGVVLLEATQLFLSSEPGVADAYRVLSSVDASALADKIISWAAVEYGIDAKEVPIDDTVRNADPDLLREEIEESLRRLADDTN